VHELSDRLAQEAAKALSCCIKSFVLSWASKGGNFHVGPPAARQRTWPFTRWVLQEPL